MLLLVVSSIEELDEIDGDVYSVCKFYHFEEMKVVEWHVFIDEIDDAYTLLSRLP